MAEKKSLIAGLAIAGIVIAVLVVLVVAVVQPGIPRRELTRRVSCMARLKQIVLSLHMYSQDHGEAFPGDLRKLYDRYVPDPLLYHCPSTASVESPEGIQMDYEYVGSLASTYPDDTVLAYDKKGNHGGDGRNVMYLDGHVEWLSEAEFQKELKRSRAAVQKHKAKPSE